MRAELAAVVLAACAASCERSPSAVSARAARTSDKADLYADASLVPTREGERARRELAIAGEITRAVRVLPAVAAVTVDVESNAEGPARTIVVARAQTPDADVEALHRELERIAIAIAPAMDVSVFVAAPDRDAPPDREVPVLLVIGLLGLGISIGVTAERLRIRQAFAGRRRRSPL